MTSGAASQDTWVFDSSTGVFYHAPSNTYAIPDPATGHWTYHTASEFHQASSSNKHHQQPLEDPLSRTITNLDGRAETEEEGEIQDDVGWGGLMEPEKLAEIEKAAKKKEKRNGEHDTFEGVHYGAGEFRQRLTATEAVSSHRSTNALHPPDTMVSASEMLAVPADYTLLRLVVVSTESPKVSAGQIAVIDTREGGVQIGRDKCEKGAPARVRLREMEVSKTHALIYWGENGDQQVEVEEDGKKSGEGWWIVDLGSTHGTFVSSPDASDQTSNNDAGVRAHKRLSNPKHSSTPFRLSHLSLFVIGSTTFQAHIHASWPCDTCQLKGGNELLLDTGETFVNTVKDAAGQGREEELWDVAMNSQQRRGNREAKRKIEMANLRESLLNRGGPKEESVSGQSIPSRGYIDRSAMRRELHRPSPPRGGQARIAGHTDVPVETAPVENKFAEDFLGRQGWQRGEGLGKDGKGRADPIMTQTRVRKRGIGAEGSIDNDEDWRMKGKLRRWGDVGGQKS
ncbi:hypothetical protein C343_03643 [Cryptococcus neoformans C23]|uniref:Angiogenic factor with G patch and FHA domains 1 n=2 Tax=Cryptococcus neoformans TaxID=5207 RepID=A0A854QBJ8_CRYNE|nr:hypothetical protein CNAG_02287 [Cryptococcus neoformans var. grubii H99]AUB25355.1 hypothetical protein CKF44_02287 [Cryptococcus neoformans var. grubii]OWZ43774.1 hypothetical protein C343_03643 [Cryptococcus neoformans var. grubii C23]OWZ54458.1 hypothetical protein C368_03602 [Cryptococcus neoformans var. grubii 125.91]OXG20871.1 hypothetical protein C361_03850 [Cryptococcus neoformans var. grubii Tu259-1]OXG50110.1 hypothetical protein C355_03074 [Cryptococcus neoformans var. grubii Th|eukprot:XP_012050056.1 hypothetical protein CNAG_02287 [Cryptococcus neoformans var. grubii H99]